MNKYAVFLLLCVYVSALPASSLVGIEELTPVPPTEATPPGAVVPVNGQVFLRHQLATIIPPVVFASVNGAEPVEVDLDIVVDGDILLYGVNFTALSVEVGDLVSLTAGQLFRDSEAVFEIGERDDEAPVIENPNIEFFSEGVSNACCDDVSSDGCGVGVGVTFDGASDEYGVGYYEIGGIDGDMVGLVVGHAAEDSGQDIGRVILHPGLDDSSTCYSVTAVDLAGNRSDYPERCLDLDSERSCLERVTNVVCSCTISSVESWPLGFFALLGFVLFLRKRRTFL